MKYSTADDKAFDYEEKKLIRKAKKLEMTETTFRKIVKDYIYHRPKYRKEMKWKSNFTNVRIIIKLEERPYSQESLGYELLKEE